MTKEFSKNLWSVVLHLRGVIIGGLIVYRMQRRPNHLFTSEPIASVALHCIPPCLHWFSRKSQHPGPPWPCGPHQVGSPAQPLLIVALKDPQHWVQDAGEQAEHLLPLFEPAEDVGGDGKGKEEPHLLHHLLLPKLGLWQWSCLQEGLLLVPGQEKEAMEG